MTAPKREPLTFCCSVFPRIVQYFGWMYSADTGVYVMPHIKDVDDRWRVNHCPSCGKEVRSIEVPKDQLEELFT